LFITVFITWPIRLRQKEKGEKTIQAEMRQTKTNQKTEPHRHPQD
jgi:hypothetical protein